MNMNEVRPPQAWEVDFTINGKISFFCWTKEDAEKMANEYLSSIILGNDCDFYEYKIKDISGLGK